MAIKDYAHKQTDKELEELEKRIAQVYEDAADEMKTTVDDYFESYQKRYEEYKKELDVGNITEDEFKQWELNQIGRGERYEDLRDSLAQRFVDADEVAMAYVNDTTPSIYSLNRNYSNYAIEQYDPELDFNLWDESTVRNLIVNQPNLMPYYPEAKAVKRGIDLAYGKEQITKSVTSGILQGKSLTRIANDLMSRIEGMSRASALRSARTAITAAENAGRQDSFEEAADMGLKMEKVWLATLDSRTRVAHQKADMQVVGYDKTFDVGGEALMFPGDNTHGASGWNLYNCRCTMFEKPEGMSMNDFERWARDPETGAKEKVSGMSYEDWIKSKNGDETAEVLDINDIDKYDRNFITKMRESGIEYNPVSKMSESLSDQQIIDKIGAEDNTGGSCASQALAYVGNENGWDVTDMRGGESQQFFASPDTAFDLAFLNGVKGTFNLQTSDGIFGVMDVLNNLDAGQYILETGGHASVINIDSSGGKQYLELQSSYDNGWKNLDEGDLVFRFNCNPQGKNVMNYYQTDKLAEYPAFGEILGYINTK